MRAQLPLALCAIAAFAGCGGGTKGSAGPAPDGRVPTAGAVVLPAGAPPAVLVRSGLSVGAVTGGRYEIGLAPNAVQLLSVEAAGGRPLLLQVNVTRSVAAPEPIGPRSTALALTFLNPFACTFSPEEADALKARIEGLPSFGGLEATIASQLSAGTLDLANPDASLQAALASVYEELFAGGEPALGRWSPSPRAMGASPVSTMATPAGEPTAYLPRPASVPGVRITDVVESGGAVSFRVENTLRRWISVYVDRTVGGQEQAEAEGRLIPSPAISLLGAAFGQPIKPVGRTIEGISTSGTTTVRAYGLGMAGGKALTPRDQERMILPATVTVALDLIYPVLAVSLSLPNAGGLIGGDPAGNAVLSRFAIPLAEELVGDAAFLSEFVALAKAGDSEGQLKLIFKHAWSRILSDPEQIATALASQFTGATATALAAKLPTLLGPLKAVDVAVTATNLAFAVASVLSSRAVSDFVFGVRPINPETVDVHGTIRFVEGGADYPVRWARVIARDAAGLTWADAYASSDGTFACRLEPGTYWLYVTAPGFEAVTQRIDLGAQLSVLLSTTWLTPFSPGIVPGGIEGLVRGAGAPLPGVLVELRRGIHDPDGAAEAPVVTGADGRFAFGPLDPGTYTLFLSRVGWSPLREVVPVPGGSPRRVMLSMEVAPPGAILATVRGPSGPLHGAVVVVRRGTLDPAGELVAQAVTGADGVAAFHDLPAGEYSLFASHPDHEPGSTWVIVMSGASADAEVSLLPVALGSVEVAPVARTVSPGEAVLLTASGGRPPYSWSIDAPSGATVDALTGTTVTYVAGPTNGATDGVTVTDGLTIAMATLTVCGAPWQVCQGACLDTSMDSANCGACGTACGAAEVCEASRCVPFAQATSSVAGTVVDQATLLPLAGATVELEPWGTPNLLRSARTGLDGSFLFTSIPPGDYLLRFRLLGYVAQERGFTVTAGLDRLEDAALTAIPPVGIAPDAITAAPGERLVFMGFGGASPYTWSVTGQLGSTVVPYPSTEFAEYVAGPINGTLDLVTVTDGLTSASASVAVCGGTHAVCGGTCVDISANPLHCGTCDNACPSGRCEASTCYVEPTPPLVVVPTLAVVAPGGRAAFLASGGAGSFFWSPPTSGSLTEASGPTTVYQAPVVDGLIDGFWVSDAVGAVASVSVVVTSQGVVVGTARNASTGEPIAGALVRLTPLEAGVPLPWEQTTAADGRFRFDFLAPGTWDLAAAKGGFTRAMSVVQVATSTLSEQDLSLADATCDPLMACGNGIIDFRLGEECDASTSESYRYYDWRAATCVDCQVRCNDPATLWVSSSYACLAVESTCGNGYLDAGEQCESSAAPPSPSLGDPPIAVCEQCVYRCLNGGRLEGWVTGNYFCSTSTSSDCGPVTGLGSIAGRVTAIETGAPLANVRVDLRPGVRSLSTSAVASATTDASGHYAVNGVAPGPYTVTFTVDGAFVTYITVRVWPDRTMGGSIALARPTVVGTVRAGHDGSGLTGVTVLAERQDAPGSLQVTTWPDGTYALPAPPGTYRLSFSRPWYASELASVEVLGAPVVVDRTLEAPRCDPLAGCGNGLFDLPREQCDLSTLDVLGPTWPPDIADCTSGCRVACHEPGLVWASSSWQCSGTPTCGNGYQDAGEDCDETDPWWRPPVGAQGCQSCQVVCEPGLTFDVVTAACRADPPTCP